MPSRGVFDGVARFGRALIFSDPKARRFYHMKGFDPLESRILLAGIPVAPQATPLANQVQGIANNLNSMGNDNTRLPLANRSLRQLNQASNPASPVQNPLSNALNDPTASNGKEQLRDAIFSQMHSYMADRTSDNNVTRDDVEIPIYNEATVSYKVLLTLDYDNPTISVPLNTGLPSLPFSITSGQVLVSTGLHYTDFSWGLNSGTYFFDTAPVDEMTVRTSIKLDRTVPIQGSMGFLAITATDSVALPNPPGTVLTGSTLIDMQSPGGVPTPANPRFSGNSHIGLNIATVNNAPIDGKPSPPDTRFGFRTDWTFTNQSPSTSFANWGSPPQVFFDNVEINLGGFLNRVMQPIVMDLQKITRQFQPIFDVLKERIPVLSDLSNLVGGDDINLIKLNSIIDSTGIIPQGIQNLLNLTIQVAQTGDALNQLKIGPGAPVINNAWMPFGSFDLSTNAPLQSLPPYVISQTLANWTSLSTHTNTTVNLALIENWIHTNVAQPFGDQIVNLIEILNGNPAQDGAWVNYGFLDNPQQGLYKLMLAQQTDLVTATFRLQNTPINLNFQIPTPIPVLDVRLNANIVPDIFIQGGYDTTGLREYIASSTPSFSMFRDGLWVNTGTHARVEGFVGVGPQTTGSVIEPFVLGGVSANFRADPLTGLVLPDPTRAHVFVDLTDKPYLATVTGNADVALRFGVKIGIDFPWPVGFVGIEPSIDLGLYHLFDYYQGVPNPFYFPPSPIATLDPTTKILTLNMGSQALRDARGIQTSEINENFHISALSDQVANAGGGQDLLVTAFGVSGSYVNVAGIVADCGDGNDVVVITADVSVPATIHGGDGDDQISYLGSGDASITGDAGNDQIIGGSGNSTIQGGAGNDNITGGSGVGVTNIIDGGADDDRLISGPGSATLIGGTGNDQLVGNNANDTLDGGDGNDSLLGAGGNDSVVGGIGNDQIDVAIGNDTVYGGAGDDLIQGGDGNDALFGEDGLDTVIGGLGADTVDGGNQGDILIASKQETNVDIAGNTMYGGSGADSIVGSSFADAIDAGSGNDGVLAYAGNDTVFGGSGFDSIYASDGNDQLTGDDDDDQLYGEIGNDTIHGNAGNDTILGFDGNDQLFGEDGADSILGQNNDDTVSGGIGSDSIYSGAGNDTVIGDADPDLIYADVGADTIRGGTGDDTILGNDGADRIYGDDGADSILGENDDDYIEGGIGNDTIQGNDGSDTILGQDDNDSINAGNQDDLVFGGLGLDTIDGRTGNDTIEGDAGDDSISGFDGIDRIRGDAGNDTITSGNDADFVRGGTGNDTIDAGAAADILYGEDGNDSITGGTGADRIDAGAGNDIVYGFAATGTDDNTADTILGRDGNDLLVGGGGADWIDGGAGTDSVAGNDNNDSLFGGSGVGDSITGGLGNDRIVGSDDGSDSDPNFADTNYFGDIIDAGAGNDTISALGGADLIIAGTGNDSIDSGTGGDSVSAGDGTDFVYAGQNGTAGDRIDGAIGADTIWGSDSNDTISGGDDNDWINAQAGADSVTGDAGDDVIDSGAGSNDTASGGAGNDQITDSGGALNIINGDAGNDTLTGSDDGLDLLNGGTERDRISGRGGNDTIDGGAGADTEFGNAGDDMITGNTGADLLIGGENHDTIYGQNASASGDDNAVDSLYGDLGTNGNEAGSGRDVLFGQGGNDLMYGEGDLDSIVGGGGANNLISYGPGGSTTAEAYSAPSPTAPPIIQPFTSFTLAGGTLPSGADYRGRWVELASSASNGGISSSGGNALEPSIAIGADGTKYVSWVEGRRGNYEVYVAKYTSGGSWQQVGANSAQEGGISNTLTSSRRPNIAIAADGNPMIAWTEITPAGSDIRVEKFDGANWVAVGSSLGAGGISNTGSADKPIVMTTSAGPVVAWMNTNVTVANAYARLFTGGTWQEFGAIGSASGTGVSANATGISDFSAATDGTKVAVTWSALDAGGIKQIYLREFSAGAWAGLGTSFTASGLSNTAGQSETPTVAYFSGQRFVSWVDNSSIAGEIYSSTFNGSTWISAGPSLNTSNTKGDATAPHLASSAGGMYLTWSDDAAVNGTSAGISIYALKWNGTAFVAELATDNNGPGVTATRGIVDVAVAASPTGRPTIAWSDAHTNGQQIFLRAGDTQVSRVFNAGGVTSVQSVLDGNALGAGDVILVSGNSTGFTVAAADAGVMIVGQPGATITSAVTINAANVTLQGLTITGAVAINAASVAVRDSTLPVVQINGTADAQLVHCTTTGLLTISGGATNSIIEHNTLAGVTIGAGGATGLSLRDNTITASVSLINAAGGTIRQNRINTSGTGLSITAPFTGLISDNDITSTSVGVLYSAAAQLSGNRISGTATGVSVTVAGPNGFGFVGTTSPNQIFNSGTGVVLANGSMQNQHIYSNTNGVTGSGILGGGTLDLANFIELNTTGVSMVGPMMYNKIARNGTGIAASSGQLIAHNIIWNNTQFGLRSSGRTDVRIFNNTFYTNTGDNLRVATANQDLQLINNILFSDGGFDINVDNDSRTGFFSDYNLLHSAGTGTLVHWLKDFNDILDWQMDVAESDLHSQGRTIINPDRSDPGFFNKTWDDFRTFGLAAGQRGSTLVVDAGTPLADQGVDVARSNLLANPSFESGVTSWNVSAGGATQSSSPTPFDGTKYFYPGSVAVGSAEQTIDLVAAGYSAGQLDAQDLMLTFGGRIRSAGQSAQLVVSFLNGSAAVIGSPIAVQAKNVNDRWELVGDKRAIPVGTRSVKFRFESTLQSGSANTSYLDSAFVYVESETNAPDLGAFGNTSGDTAQVAPAHLALRSPDLYTDLILAAPIDIRWDSFGNTADAPVKIDLYQDTADGPAFLLNITPGTADTGHYTWIPLSSGLTAGTTGLRIQLTLATDNISLDRSAEASTVPEAGTSYFIDDTSNTNDEYTPAAIGSNRNTGKLATAPKPLLTTLTRVYDLNPSDTVFVDTGTYQHFRTLTISGANAVGDDEGATFTGPTNASRIAQISALGFSTGALVDINQGDFTTITHLTLGGGAQYGLWLRNSSTNNAINFVTEAGASLDGVRVDATSVPVNMHHLDVSSNGQNGVWVEGPWTGLSDSKVYNNVQTGVRATNTLGAATFEANEVYGNGTGISVYNNAGGSPTIIGNANLALGRGNKVYNNTVYGIEANTNVQVLGNTVYGSGGTNHAAIRAYNAVLVSKNIAYNSNIGIWGGTVTANRVFGNSYGIFQSDLGNESPGPTTQNVIYSNVVGYRDDHAPNVASSAQPIFVNNLVYGNTSTGVIVNGGASGTIYNNTIYQTSGDAIQVNVNLATVNVQIRNNVLHVDGASGYALNIASGSQPGITTDFNMFDISGSAKVGFWSGAGRTTLQDWRFASGQDQNSLAAAPLFVDIDGSDNQLGVVGGVDFGSDDNFHENSPTGSYKGGVFAPVVSGVTGLPVDQAGAYSADAGNYSPVIDRGDDTIALVNEPAPNGSFTNLGAFGNTTQASKSPAQYALVLIPNGSETWVSGQTFPIKWRQETIPTGTVLIELLHKTGPSTDVLESTIQAAAPNNGTFNWLVPSVGLPAGTDYVIRVTRNGTPSINDVSDNTFTISPPTPYYYVNDSLVSPGDLTTAPGNDTNDGLTPSTPKATIQALLNAYDFGPGDIIRVDRGYYSLSNNIVISQQDSGVTITGFTGTSNSAQWSTSVLATAPTHYYRLGESSGTTAVDSSGNGRDATYENGVVLGAPGALDQDANTAVTFDGVNDDVRLPNGFQTFPNGFSFEAWVKPSNVASFQPIFDIGNGNASNNLVFYRNSTTNDLNFVVYNGASSGAVLTAPGALALNEWQHLAVTLTSAGAAKIYRNGVQVAAGNVNVPNNVVRTLAYIAKSNFGNAPFGGSLDEAAFYDKVLDPTAIAARFELVRKESTITRANTSAGASDFEFQNADNVSIQNLYLTGGYNAILAPSSSDSDGVTISGNVLFRSAWNQVEIGTSNDNWLINGNTIRNGGGRGMSLAGSGSTISGNQITANSAYGIDVTNPNTISGNTVFANSNIGILSSYGNSGNTALPKLIIENNTVYSNATRGIDAYNNWVVVRNNTVYGHTAGNGETYAGIYAQGAEITNNISYGNRAGILGYGTFTGNRVFNNTNSGISAQSGATVEQNIAYNNGGYGIYGAGYIQGATRGPWIRGNLSYSNGSGGIFIDAGTDTQIWQNTVYQPVGGDGIGLGSQSVNTSITNNIVVVGSGIGLNYGSAAHSNLSSDYNLVYVNGAGSFARLGGQTSATKADFYFSTSFDQHTLTSDPLFVDPDGADNLLGFSAGADHGADDNFSLQSSSPAIDSGDPGSYFYLEPLPNGSRVNLGHQGNTLLATTSAARSVRVLSPNGLEKLAVGTPVTINFATTGISQSAAMLLMNAGGNAISQWSAQAFVSGLSQNLSNANAIDLSGVTAPAPQSVYQQYARGGFNQQLTYGLPLPDGNYTIRLHFMEPDYSAAGQRLMDVRVNGTLVNTNYDIYAGAGARYKATTLSYSASASGGTGLTLGLTGKNNYPIISAIEVTAAVPSGLPNPKANIDVSYDNGANFSPVAANVPINNLGAGSYLWTPDTTSDQALIRVTDVNSPAQDTSDSVFVIGDSGVDYYINDGSLTGDVFTTAIGLDTNSGKTPSKPMRSLQALLDAYDLGPGDVIHVDTGTYSLSNPVTIIGNDSGVTITGPSGAGSPTAVFSRASASSAVFWFNGGSNITLNRVGITGGNYGIYAYTDGNFPSAVSTNLTISNNEIYGNSVGMFMANQGSGSLINNNLVRNNSGVSMDIENYYGNTVMTMTATGNEVRNNGSGLTFRVSGGAFSNNLIYSNGSSNSRSVQVYTNGVADTISATGNTIRNNTAGYALSLGGAVIADGNFIYDNTGSGVEQNATFKNNLVYHNTGDGMVAGQASINQNNRVFGNTGVGINVTEGATVTGNVVYSNNRGIAIGTYYAPATVTNNLIYSNTVYGMALSGGGGGFGGASNISNNTIYQPLGDGILINSSSQISFRNNIIVVGTGYAESLTNSNAFGLVMDYNDVLLTGTGKFGKFDTDVYPTRTDWFYEFGWDAHSLSTDPQFADPDGADNLLGFSGGVDHGLDDNFATQTASPTIDAGDPFTPYFNEPAPNGGRANQGHTGNTAAALTSSPAGVVQVLSPSGLEKLERDAALPITWRTGGLLGPTPDSSYASAVQSFGPALYLRLNETSGTVANDMSGNNRNGSYQNGTLLNQLGVWGAGKDSAVSFDGVDDNVQVPSTALNLQSQVTISAWINPTALDRQWMPIIVKGGGQYYTRTYSLWLNQNGSLLFDTSDVSGTERSVTTPTGLVGAGQWTHLAATMNKTTGAVAIYVNGQLVTSATVNPVLAWSATQPLYVGYSTEDPTYRFNGLIDEVAVYPTALSAQQIGQIYGADKGTVDIALLNSGGNVVATVASGVPNTGTYSWSIPGSVPEGKYRIRVTSNVGTHPSGQSGSLFDLVSGGHDYYVNDNLPIGDVFTTTTGNNANTGKSPSAPMRTVGAVLNMYDLDAGDVIHVDTGNYNLLYNLRLQLQDSGVRIEGPQTGAGQAIFDRGVVADGNYAAFEMVGGDDVTLDKLVIRKGGYGVVAWSGNNSDGITISRSDISGQYDYAIYDYDTNDNWTITGNTIHDNTGTFGQGIIVDRAKGVTVTNNTVSNIQRTGISVTNADAASLVQGNTVFGATTGMTVDGTLNAAGIGAGVFDNIVHDCTTGISIGSGSTSFGYARGNIIYLNGTGLVVNYGSLAEKNRVYANTGVGIVGNDNSTIRSNQIYSNATGVQLGRDRGFVGSLLSNIIYGNTTRAVNVTNSNNADIVNNTIYSIVGDAIRLSGAPNTLISNNILWTNAASSIFVVDAGSQTGLQSDRNLFFGTGSVGSWNGAVQATLANWQTASGKDAASVVGDPLFVDIDGADNVLGYRTLPSPLDGGADDNFFVARLSPAIDRGSSASSSQTDFYGGGPADDPGTPNTGTNYQYTPTVAGSSLFSATGTAQNFRTYNTNFLLNLPFAFNFYGTSYNSVRVGVDGLLQFGGGNELTNDPANSTAKLLTRPAIAALWDDLYTYGVPADDVFVDTSVANQVKIRWNATFNTAALNDVEFDVVLFSDGSIRLDYGPGNIGLSPTVGISAGNGLAYQMLSYDGMATLTNVNSITIAATSGVSDIGAIEFRGNSNDTAPPTMTSTIPPAIFSGGTVTSSPAGIVLNLSEPLNRIDAAAIANYELRWAGTDTAFDTGDDIIFTLTPQYVDGSSQVTLLYSPTTLPDGNYRLTARSNIADNTGLHDRAGILLDGDNNATPGGTYVRTFTVAKDVGAPTVLNSSFNVNATPPSITVQFSEDVSASLSLADIVLQNLTTHATIPSANIQLVYGAGNTVTLTFPGNPLGILPDGNYRLTITAAGVTDGAGNPLASDHVLDFFALAGDANRDRVVDLQDLGILSGSFNQLAKIFTDGDFNHDGTVNSVDLGILSGNWQKRLTSDVTAPSVSNAGYLFATSPNKLSFTFSEDVSASLSASSLTVLSVPGNVPVAVSGFTYDPLTNIATFTLATSLPDGNYRASIAAGNVVDPSGNQMSSAYSFDFFVLAGDANHDRVVDGQDLYILQANWQQSGRNFLQGDFNYDGIVNAADLGVLSINWQKSLPPPAPPAVSISIIAPPRTPTRAATRVAAQVLGA